MNNLLSNFFNQDKASVSDQVEDATWLGNALSSMPADIPQPQEISSDEHRAMSLSTDHPRNMAADEPDESSNQQTTQHDSVQNCTSANQSQESTDLNECIHAEPIRQSLIKYRPIKGIPPFRGRRSKTPPSAESSWMIPIDWPPPKPSPRTLAIDAAIVPPDGSPFHLHVQAYALRWGTWASSIKDYNRREQVLKFVTGEMRKAWETAIKEGYYIKPSVTVDEQSDDPGVPSKKHRKKAVSPSREAAPFVSEAKPDAPITNGELEATGITMDTINARVASHDLQEGEQLLEAITAEKGRLLEKSDWRGHPYANSSVNRDIFIFCLYTVQQSRKEAAKMHNLLGHFTRESQKKNTQIRIATYTERAEQHLALAIELHHRKQDEQETVSEGQSGPEENDRTSSSHEQEMEDADQEDEDKHQDQNAYNSLDVEQLLMTLAREICSVTVPAGTQQIFEIFTANALTLDHFNTQNGLQVDGPYLSRLKIALKAIFENVTTICTSQMRRQRANDQPAELIKIKKDLELTEYHLRNTHQNLCAFLQWHQEQNNSTAQGDVGVNDLIQTTVPLKVQQKPKDSATANPAHNNPNLCTQVPASSSSDEQRAWYDTLPPPIRRTTSDGRYDTLPPPTRRSSTDPRFEAFTPQLPNAVTNITMQAGPKATQADEVTTSRESTATIGRSTTPSIPPTTAMAVPSSATQSPVITRNSAAPSTMPLYRAGPATISSYIKEVWAPWLQRNDCQLPQEQITSWAQIETILLQRGLETPFMRQTYAAFHDHFPKWYQKQHPANHPQPMEAYNLPTDDEIRVSIPANGMKSKDLLLLFQHRIGWNELQDFNAAVQRVAYLSNHNDLLYAKTPASIEPQLVYKHPSSTYNSSHLVNPTPLPNSPYVARPFPPQNSPHLPRLPPASNSPHLARPLPPPNSAHLAKPNPPPSTPSRPSAIKLKIHPPKETAPPSDQTDYCSTQINSTSGFSFRHLPSSTLAQRKRSEENIEAYVASMRKRKKPWGEYIAFNDPEDPHAGPVAHGVWNTKDGGQPAGMEWFFEGREMPAGHNIRKRDGEVEGRKRKRVRKAEADMDRDWDPRGDE